MKKQLLKNRTNNLQSEELVRVLLSSFGENPNREGLRETPKRVVKMYKEVLGGYKEDPKTLLKTFPSNGYHDLVTIANIKFYSLCEHHMIPFFGKIHIGYIPNGRILGLSKFARLVEIYSKRLQTQENLTKQISDFMQNGLHPQGFIVHTEAEHLCVNMRGVKKPGFVTKTTIKKGVLEKRLDLVDQFFRDIKEYLSP